MSTLTHVLLTPQPDTGKAAPMRSHIIPPAHPFGFRNSLIRCPMVPRLFVRYTTVLQSSYTTSSSTCCVRSLATATAASSGGAYSNRRVRGTSFVFKSTSASTARFTSTSTSTSSTTARMAAFERLIRFETPEGDIKFGDLGKAVPTKEIEGREVEVLEGDVKVGFKKGGGKAKVGKVCLFLFFVFWGDWGISLLVWSVREKSGRRKEQEDG